jgi:hypothetical protein
LFETLVLGVIIEQNAMQAFGINFLVILVELFFSIFMVLTFWQFLGTNVLWQDFACTDLSQMDKASIIGDAVNYVQELQKEVEEMELAESLNVESECCGSVGDDSGSIITDTTGPEDAVMTVINGSYTNEAKAAAAAPAADSTNQKSPITTEKNSPSQVHSVKKKILHLEVARLEEETYHLRILCQKGHGVLVQLMQALESLGIDVVNAHHTSVQDNILNTFVAQVKNWEMMETEDVRQKLLGVVAQYGLVQA